MKKKNDYLKFYAYGIIGKIHDKMLMLSWLAENKEFLLDWLSTRDIINMTSSSKEFHKYRDNIKSIEIQRTPILIKRCGYKVNLSYLSSNLLRNIKTLHIQDSAICCSHSTSLQYIKDTTNLKKLILINNKLDSVCNHVMMSPKPQLESLFVANNSLTEYDLSCIKGFSNLKELTLINVKLNTTKTDILLDCLLHLKELETLSIDELENIDAITRIIRFIPNLKIKKFIVNSSIFYHLSPSNAFKECIDAVNFEELGTDTWGDLKRYQLFPTLVRSITITTQCTFNDIKSALKRRHIICT